MKKLHTYFFGLFLVLILNGCGGGSDSKSTTASDGKCSNEFITNYREVTSGFVSPSDKSDFLNKCDQFLKKYGDNHKCQAKVKKANDLDYKEQEISSGDVKASDSLCEKAKSL